MTDISTYVRALVDAGGEVFEVGGPVRDRFLGRPVKDHDLLCRNLPMQRITSILAPFGKVAAVGKSFGVIKFSPHRDPGVAIDIALPRREISTGSGHRDFAVDFDPNLPVELDLGRRDFTMNAMAMSLSDGRIIDPFGGQRDLEARVLRMVFPRAFEEDPLRLIRGIQFAARFALAIEPETWEAMRRSAKLIETVSPERISAELIKLLGAPRPSVGFNLMVESDLLRAIIPELSAIRGIEQDKQPGDDVFGHTMRVLDAARGDPNVENRGDIDLLFAALLHDIGKAKTARPHPTDQRVVFFGHQIVSARLAKKWMNRMKVSACGVDIDVVLLLIEHHMFETKSSFSDRAIRRFVSKVGTGLISKLLDLRLSDNRGGKHPRGIKGVERLRTRIREELAKKPPFGPKDMAIDGHDLMGLGLAEGPVVGRILRALVECVLDEPAHNERDKLLALAKEMLENPSIIERLEARAREEGEDADQTKS